MGHLGHKIKLIDRQFRSRMDKNLENLGITTMDEDRDAYAPLGLGGISNGVTNLELTGAYAAIANGGYSDMVMEAASAAGAQGGTVLHTRAADAANGNKFFGMAITEEREMILLVTPAEKRAAIMQAIMEKAGAQSEAQSVVFSVALDEVAGLYSVES